MALALIVGGTTFDRLFADVRFDEVDGDILFVYAKDEETAVEMEDTLVRTNDRFAPEAVPRHSQRFRKRLIVNSGHAKPAQFSATQRGHTEEVEIPAQDAASCSAASSNCASSHVLIPRNPTTTAKAQSRYSRRRWRVPIVRWTLYSPSKVSADQPFIHFFSSTAEFVFITKRRHPRRREGIIPRCRTVRPVLDWRKITHRLALRSGSVLLTRLVPGTDTSGPSEHRSCRRKSALMSASSSVSLLGV
jgi:hypothetical protein